MYFAKRPGGREEERKFEIAREERNGLVYTRGLFDGFRCEGRVGETLSGFYGPAVR